MSPTKPFTRCPRCRQLHPGTGKCPACKAATATKRSSGSARGWTKKWAEFSAAYLEEHPTCVRCGQRSTDVDHIDGTGRNGPRAYDRTNLRALCHGCHSARTARDQPGGFNRPSELTSRAPGRRPPAAPL